MNKKDCFMVIDVLKNYDCRAFYKKLNDRDSKYCVFGCFEDGRQIIFYKSSDFISWIMEQESFLKDIKL